MAGVPPPQTDIDVDTFPSPDPGTPTSGKNTTLRVMFIHGGGSKAGFDRTQEPFAVYLRAHFKHFSMRQIDHTSDFGFVVDQHAQEIAEFKPDVLLGRSQGGWVRVRAFIPVSLFE